MVLRIFFLIALVFAFLHLGQATKCDPEIVAKIEKIWNGNVPQYIISTAIANVKEVVVGTTHDYYPEGTNCVYSFFMKDRVLIVYVFQNGTTSVQDTPVVESNGTTYAPGSATVRYHVFTKGGVTALYTCTKDGKEGAAKGLVKLRYSKYDPADVEEAKEVLKSIGVEITDEYPDHCC
uniref:Lipocalin/cytosolic fatty-acid binding domain-containing protein n=1 Tax=Cuerna arida TaxID=1464854 RepID=A0A1B6FMS4_9HEMI